MFLIPSDKMTSKHFSTLEYKNDAKLDFVNGGFIKKKLFGNETINGVVINLIHGKSGEDGQIAALLDFYNIAFIGPRIEASAVSFNKALSKVYALSRGVNVLEYAVVEKSEIDSVETFLQKVNCVLKKSHSIIIKPARLGSSIGISIIKDINNTDELNYALDAGFELDDTLLVEPFIAGINEYNLAGCAINGEFMLSIIESVSKDEFLDFDRKYLDFSGNRAIVEAKIDEELQFAIKNAFKKIYINCFEGALIRCDFFVIDKKVYLNEINPIPGSMAYYLFSDVKGTLDSLSKALPQKKTINIQYRYISSIQASKGK